MARRTIEISSFDAHLSVRNGQVRVIRDDTPVGQFPADEVGLLIADTRSTTFSNSTLIQITANGGLVVLCGEDHLPAALVVPVSGNQLLQQRQQLQMEMTVPGRKRLWQEIVQAKIRNQAAATDSEATGKKLAALIDRVKSGDPDNVEAQAARLYWSTWLGEDKFLRDRNGAPPNLFLNYGYMTLRAAIARSLFAFGLNPSFGLHHSNRANAFCLADDLVEPFRPFVDIIVRELHHDGKTSLTKECKARLLQVLYQTCAVDNYQCTLQAAADRAVRSLLRRLSGEKSQLALPRIIPQGSPALPEAPETDEETFRG